MYMEEKEYDQFIDDISRAIESGYVEEEETFYNDKATDAVIDVLIKHGIINEISAN